MDRVVRARGRGCGWALTVLASCVFLQPRILLAETYNHFFSQGHDSKKTVLAQGLEL